MPKETDYEMYEIINAIMDVLKFGKIPLTRPAVCIMLNTGILTQETRYEYYRFAKNIYDYYTKLAVKAVNADEEKEEIIKAIPVEEKEKYFALWQEWKNMKKKCNFL